ncbi:DNA-directed RNA polymerase I subunit rpa49 [Elasticomyces elasticus]|nr:DNA-directed RNA polymerase I subunit rpa49 [Elasticomyces elasticus]
MAQTEGKKRKRQSDVAEASNKKSAISVSYLDDDALRPLLVSTPGLTAPSIPFQAYTKPRSSKHTGKTPNPATHDILLHSSAHQRVDYTAAPSTTDQYLTHYLAVFDPATQTLQITPAHHLNLRSTPRKQAPIDEEAQKHQRATYTAQREDLGKAFGTKKAQKFIASRTDNAIDKDPKGKGKKSDVQDAILESMSVASTPQQQQKHSEQDDLLASKPIPRPNLAAENVEDVYNFDTLIPPAEARLIQVRDWQTAARANEPVVLGHRFPVFRLGAAAKSDEITKLKALRYIALLLAFHDSLTGGGRNGKKVPKKEALLKHLLPPGKEALWSEALIDSVRIRFASSASNHTEVPKWELEKLYTHICALTLYVDDWRTDTTAIREDLKMDAKQLGLYFAELAAKIVPPTERERADLGVSKAQAGAMKFARLKLPLEFPKAGVGRRR